MAKLSNHVAKVDSKGPLHRSNYDVLPIKKMKVVIFVFNYFLFFYVSALSSYLPFFISILVLVINDFKHFFSFCTF